MNLKNKRILVTGGAGFIGSHIVDSLVVKGAAVTVFDDFSSGKTENIQTIKKYIRVIKGNILDYRAIKNASRNMDIVSHQAAHLEILKCVHNPIEDLTNNTIGTLNVFRSCLANGIGRVMVASSACVYGQAKYVPQDENHPKDPNWEYGVSKFAVEKYSNIFHTRYGMDITNLRYSIVYGPREWYGRVLTLFLKRALQGKPLIIFGDGKQKRDFIFVDDVVRLHNLSLEKNAKSGEVYNASTGIGTTIMQLALSVKKITGKDVKIIFDHVKEGEVSALSRRVRLISELRSMVLDSRKAQAVFGWKPSVGLDEGLAREYSWLQNNVKNWNKMSV